MIALVTDAGLILFAAGTLMSAIAMACQFHSDKPTPYPTVCASCMIAVFLIVAVTL